MVPVGCGQCMECRKQKAGAWSIRLQEEVNEHKPGWKHFITLTLSNEQLQYITQGKDTNGVKRYTPITGKGYEFDNAIATTATRRFLERWRKKYKRSIKHWLITELGGNGTENIHLHGVLFLNEYLQRYKPQTISLKQPKPKNWEQFRQWTKDILLTPRTTVLPMPRQCLNTTGAPQEIPKTLRRSLW